MDGDRCPLLTGNGFVHGSNAIREEGRNNYIPCFIRSIDMYFRVTIWVLMILIVPSVATSRPASERPLVLDFLLVGEITDIWLSELGHGEPGIDVILVPLRAFGAGDVSDADLYRLSRLYFPRNMESLLAYNVLLFDQPRLNLLTVNQQSMMVDFAGTQGRTSIAFSLSHWAEVQLPWIRSPIQTHFPSIWKGSTPL